MKKGVTFFVFICLLVFDVSACGRENVSDPSEGKKASAENPKTTDRSSEESEQTSEPNIGTNGGVCERRGTFRTN